ncbi:hypothetical protein SBY92_004598 [Candida maltosa Xu316]
MSLNESSRSINHKLNELLSKNNINKTKLDESTALSYATILKTNILGKDKQEKVNSIVVLAKLLDCIIGSDAISDDFIHILDHTLFQTLFSIVSANMSSETYKAILKISVIDISGTIFRTKDDSIDKYLPLYESLIEYLDVIDIITTKLFLQDNKITFNSIKLINDLINKALKFDYNGIITLTGRLKHVSFFGTVGNLLETDDKLILESIEALKSSYFKLNNYLNDTKFDISIKSHQTMLNNLFIYLETSLNEYGTPATTDEYIRAGFTDNPRQFIIDNFTILLAMDLKIFLKDPNFTFKKRFHEELMMSDHQRTFPLAVFIEKTSNLLLDIYNKNASEFPNIYTSVLSYEVLIYYLMNQALILFQETRASSESKVDVAKIMNILLSQLEEVEVKNKRIDDSIIGNGGAIGDARSFQIKKIEANLDKRWDYRLSEFHKILQDEVSEFVSEIHILKLLHGVQVTQNSRVVSLKLSPDRSYLETSEDLKIAVKDIGDIKVTNVSNTNDKKNLINIASSVYKNSIISKDGQLLLTCFTDSGTIFDGLVVSNAHSTGEIAKLIDVRRKTQMLDLAEIDDSDEEDEEENEVKDGETGEVKHDDDTDDELLEDFDFYYK